MVEACLVTLGFYDSLNETVISKVSATSSPGWSPDPGLPNTIYPIAVAQEKLGHVTRKAKQTPALGQEEKWWGFLGCHSGFLLIMSSDHLGMGPPRDKLSLRMSLSQSPHRQAMELKPSLFLTPQSRGRYSENSNNHECQRDKETKHSSPIP